MTIAALLAACAGPGGLDGQATAGLSGSDKRATTCLVNGFFVGNRVTPRSAPTMIVSDDGVCVKAASAQGGSSTGVAASITPVVQPLHGRLATATAGTAVEVGYTPNPGYAGPDSFAVRMGPGGLMQADFAVTVVKP